MKKYSVLFKIFDRIISVAVYTLPFLELYGFFNVFLCSSGLRIPELQEAAYFLKANSWLNFLMFTTIVFLTQSRKLNLSYFARYNLMQALIIIFLSSFLDTCGYLFPYFVLGQGSIGNFVFNILCLLCIVLVIYCAIFAARGKIPKIPLLTEAVRLQLWT